MLLVRDRYPFYVLNYASLGYGSSGLEDNCNEFHIIVILMSFRALSLAPTATAQRPRRIASGRAGVAKQSPPFFAWDSGVPGEVQKQDDPQST